MKLIRMVGFGIITAVAAAALAAGGNASSASLDDMTLRESDLPAGFDQVFSHRLPRAEMIEIQGAVTSGYRGGWQREFTRAQGVDSALVTSSVLKYATADDAHRAVRRSWRHIVDHAGAKRLLVGRPLGHEARAIAYQTTGGITAYAVVWRYKNVNGSVLVVGLKSLGVTLDLATRLAVRQQRHIRLEV